MRGPHFFTCLEQIALSLSSYLLPLSLPPLSLSSLMARLAVIVWRSTARDMGGRRRGRGRREGGVAAGAARGDRATRCRRLATSSLSPSTARLAVTVRRRAARDTGGRRRGRRRREGTVAVDAARGDRRRPTPLRPALLCPAAGDAAEGSGKVE